MGVYLNSKKPHMMFQEARSARYFVDKSSLLNELIPVLDCPDLNPVSSDKKTSASPHNAPDLKEGINQDLINQTDSVTDENIYGKDIKYICITRPRRFGKTTAANMISSYFGKGSDSLASFQGLAVSEHPLFEQHINKHHVIHIAMNELPDNCNTYEQYISRIKRRLFHDLVREFPDIALEEDDSLWDNFNSIIEFGNGEKFIFVLDEWDFIFHRDFVTGQEKAAYLNFLSSLFKDQPYVELAYLTGILPIAKYSSGSELNMFCEYTMASEAKYAEYFGFTAKEVDRLYLKYLKLAQNDTRITREALRIWYDGYHTKSGKKIYNPRSVVLAFTNNNLGNYWTSSGPYDEIFYYIKRNTFAVRDDLAVMVSGTPIAAKIREYAAVSMNLSTKDEIFSAMVVYGFLDYHNGYVSIPNKELMMQFTDLLCKEPSLGYVHRLAKASEQMLAATKALDTAKMAEILEYAHDTESPLLHYSNETELTMIVNMVYLSARDDYRIEREDKAGIGYADFIFYPLKKDDDCIILELKSNSTALEAIQQIKDRRYALRFKGKLGEAPEYTGRILAVGISYNKKKDKKHCCEIEILK